MRRRRDLQWFAALIFRLWLEQWTFSQKTRTQMLKNSRTQEVKNGTMRKSAPGLVLLEYLSSWILESLIVHAMSAFASLPFWLFLSGEPWTKIMLASSDWAGLEGDTQKESSKADLGIYMQRAISTKNGGKSLPQGIRRRRSSAATKKC